jgi:hypothetical protein
MGRMAFQPLSVFRALILFLSWNVGVTLLSALEVNIIIPNSGSGSLSLSTTLATAGVPLTFVVSSTDSHSIICVQVLNSSAHLLNSFVGSGRFNGSFSLNAALRHNVLGYTLYSGGLNFSSSSVPFGRFHAGLEVSTIKHVELSYNEVLRPFVQWEGMLKGPCTGDFYLNITSSHAYALHINSTVLTDNLHLRVVGLSSTIIPLHLVENSFSDIKVFAHVIRLCVAMRHAPLLNCTLTPAILQVLSSGSFLLQWMGPCNAESETISKEHLYSKMLSFEPVTLDVKPGTASATASAWQDVPYLWTAGAPATFSVLFRDKFGNLINSYSDGRKLVEVSRVFSHVSTIYVHVLFIANDFLMSS